MSDDSIQLRDQVGVLRRRWWIVAGTVLLAIGAGLLLSFLQTPVYSAGTEVLLPPAIEGETLTAEQVATEAKSVVLVADDVISTLGLDESTQDLLDDVAVTPDPDGAAVITIAATRPDKEESAQIANEMAAAYIAADNSQTSEQVATFDSRIEDLDQEIADLSATIDTTTVRKQAIRLLSERRRLLAERTLLIDARAVELQRSEVQSDRAEVVTPAVTPSSASSPKPLRNAALAGVLGLLVGIGLAYLRDYFDDSVRDEEQLGDSLSGRPVLGHIPHWGRSGRSRPVTLASPQEPASEAYRELGANVRFLLGVRQQGDPARRQPGRVVLVSSASSEEGKTVTAVNLAVVAAAANLRVVLVDANLRRPRVHELLGVTAEVGLADVLSGTCTTREAMLDVGLDNLLVLPGGAVPPNPADLLTSPRLARLLSELRREADLVLLDSSAVLRVADALELARGCDLTVLVARSKVSRGRDLTETVHRIQRVGGNIAGVVLNDLKTRRGRDDEGYGS